MTRLGGLVVLASLLGAAASACSAAGDGGSAASGGAGGGAASGGAGGTLTGGSGGSAGSALDGGGAGGGPTKPCPDVDVLFVVDNSASMADQQQSLIASFPGFIRAIRERIPAASSTNVGVVSSDAYPGNAAGCRKIGDLVTETRGLRSSNRVCIPSGNPRFMTAADPDLDATFACVAQIGIAGSDDERMARAVLDATSPARNAPGACNAGFHRQASLLVVVMITDEDDTPDGCESLDPPQNCQSYGSGGDPDAWHRELVANKGGYEQNVVMLALLGRRLDNACGAVPASKLIGFTNRFQNSHLGDVCASSYDQFFADALPVIDTACRNYVPPE